ncbi:MAG: DUF2117 domain-containing protein, partial [Methanoregula sp.]|nr:DUF2117 domain-containing protein [Methanoregula sp.]
MPIPAGCYENRNKKGSSMNTLPDSVVMVVHGPELFDRGDVAWLMDVVSPKRVIVAGVMARTAAEESGLPVEFNAQPPGRVIHGLDGPVFLANRGKTEKTGEIFGNIVASRLSDTGLVHLECSSRTVYCWNNGNEELAGILSDRTGYGKKSLKSTVHRQENVREIRGCIPGEAVYVNGIVIGRATAEVVVLQSTGYSIQPHSGLEPKPHGLEKLSLNRNFDISTAWCKSGPIRSVVPRMKGRVTGHGRVLVIDHCGHELYARIPEECCGVLAIGDDTTGVCGHICSHRGIPVLGIVDGDEDTIVPSAFAPGSVVLEMLGERDDDAGKEIAGKVPDVPIVWDDWVEEIIGYLDG